MSSKPFRFFVGDEKKEFTIHKTVVTHHSEPLTALVDGPMLEAKEGFAVLKDIDPDTFVRFCEYAYKGDYTSAEPDDIISRAEGLNLGEEDGIREVDDDPVFAAEAAEPVPAEEPSNIAEPPDIAEPPRSVWGEHSIALVDDGYSNPTTRRAEAATIDDDIWVPKKPKKGKKRKGKPEKTRRKKIDDLAKSKKSLLSASPDARAWRRLHFWRAFTGGNDSFPPRYDSNLEDNNAERESSCDYTPVLLAHARVYAFADTYAIPALARLSVNHLRDVLVDLKLGIGDQSQLQSVISLLDFTYSHTADRSEGGKIDILRDLLVHYTSCVVEYLEEDREFLELLEKNGQIGRDLITYMMRRLA